MEEKNNKILVVIPARSGSKGLLNKNIKLFNGIPLLAWSIKQAQKSRYSESMKIFVSTDSEEYAQIAIKYGAEVPVLRPSDISGDTSTDLEFMQHAINYYSSNGYEPDIILHLRPTQPCRKVLDIDKCLTLFLKSLGDGNNYSSLRTVVKMDKTPFKTYRIIDDVLVPLFSEVETIKEPFNQARQILPQCYLHNGYIDILLPKIIKSGCLSGNKIYPYLMDSTEVIDIDTEKDWNNALASSS